MSTLQQHAQSISTAAGDYLTARAHHEKLGRGARRLPHLSNHDIQSRWLESKFCRIWTPNGLRVTSSATWKRASIFVSLCFLGFCFGGPGEIRTHDLFHAMEARSQLRHRPLPCIRWQVLSIYHTATHAMHSED